MSAIDEVAPAIQLPGFGHLVAARRDRSTAPRASAALVSRQQWERRYRTQLRVSDTAIVMLLCIATSVAPLLTAVPPPSGVQAWEALRAPLCAIVLWLVSLSLFNTRVTTVMGVGPTEYTRVAHATGLAFGMLAILAVVFDWGGLGGFLLVTLPLGLFLLLLSRWTNRRWLTRQRLRGSYSSRTVVVGTRDDIEYAIRTISPEGRLGYRVVGVAVLDEDAGSITVDGITYPATHGTDAVARTAHALRADTIVVTNQPNDDPSYVKRLAWELEGTASELVLCSRIADVAGPRMTLSPVEGLPLIHVKIPMFEGSAYMYKRALDIITSSLALLVFAPFAAVIALLIKLDDPGPALFYQSRVGRDGREFKMVKFRSMRVDAESELQALLAANEGAGLLFKMKDDPRVTRVGRVLRRFSLDEVPQFWNVLRGDMSVVGPRPPLPSEVTAYDGNVYRRLYIKPGITGPWQVGGRSDLSWEESVRLDLRYVENWSVLSDLVLMWRTALVMLRPEGAY